MITILKNGKRVKYFTASQKNVVKYIERLAGCSIHNISFKKSLMNDIFWVNGDCYTICYC